MRETVERARREIPFYAEHHRKTPSLDLHALPTCDKAGSGALRPAAPVGASAVGDVPGVGDLRHHRATPVHRLYGRRLAGGPGTVRPGGAVHRTHQRRRPAQHPRRRPLDRGAFARRARARRRRRHRALRADGAGSGDRVAARAARDPHLGHAFVHAPAGRNGGPVGRGSFVPRAPDGPARRRGFEPCAEARRLRGVRRRLPLAGAVRIDGDGRADPGVRPAKRPLRRPAERQHGLLRGGAAAPRYGRTGRPRRESASSP